MVKLNETQKRYMIVFENHVDSKTKDIFDHYLRKDIETLRERMKDGIASKEDISLKWLLLKYRFPREMREFLINFVYNNDIDASLLQPSIYFVDQANQTVLDDSGMSREKWQKLQDASKVAKLYRDNAERKIVINGAVTLDQLRDFLKRNWKEMSEHVNVGVPASNYMTSRGVKSHSIARRDYRIAELSEEGKNHKEINNKLADEFPGFTVSHKDVNTIKSKLKKLRDEEYKI